MNEEILDDSVVIRAVSDTHVYLNDYGDVVIKQDHDGEDAFIFIPVAYLNAVIVAMKKAAKGLPHA